jgi:general stress protein 26
MEQHQDQVRHCYAVLDQFDTAMLITRTAHGEGLRARPMAIAQVDDSGDIWFISERHTGKIDEIQFHHKVHVTCQRDRDYYLSLSGMAELVDDRGKVADIWKEPYKVWFPNGKEDPDLVLIRLEPESAEFWDNAGEKKLQYTIDSIRAYMTGSKPDPARNDQYAAVQL